MSDEQNHKHNNGAPDFNQLELGVLSAWEENRTFEKSLERTRDGQPYVFYDGPPFATGLPHYGHILASTAKDAVPRYQTMRGRSVRRRWGWDCHGLPIENIVERELKISGKKQIESLGIAEFNERCRSEVLRFAAEWGKMVRRMGRWVDFENSYKTMDPSYMESVWWALRQLWDKQLIYEDRKVLLYCPRCETPISNFEVAMDNSYREVTEESVYVKFKVLPHQRILSDLTDDRTYFLAWTTTPWTLPGNTSLNLGPDISYTLVEQNGERYILAKDRLGVLEGHFETVRELSARSLEGLEYEPLYPGVIPQNGRASRVYLAGFVTTEDGTGVVHNAAMYGEEDYQLAREKDLPKVDMLSASGRYLERAPEHLRGVFFKDADRLVVKDLKAAGRLYKSEHYRHSYPHCYRCGTPLFYSALPAWFINIQRIKKDLVEKNRDISWYPEHLKYGRFEKSVEQAPDWNISRNRYWATPLPFWRSEDPEHPEVVCVGSVEELRQLAENFSEVYPQVPEGPITPDVLKTMDLHRQYVDRLVLRSPSSGARLVRVPEVVDCWVESASMPFAELHYPFEGQEEFKARYPADFVVEYIAQTRAWFYVMHVVGVALFGGAPFRNVVTTGTVLAEDGSKMSKSKNNFPDPWVVLERYGIDAVRFYLLQSPVMTGDDLNFSEKGVQEVQRKVGILLYNVWGFYRTYESARFEGTRPEPRAVLDRWILAKLDELVAEVTAAFEGYATVRVCRAIAAFVDELSTWYLRRSRDRMKAGDPAAKGSLATLGYVLTETSKLLAPVMPFLSDFLYRDLTGRESVHLERWPEASGGEPDAVLRQMEVVREIVSVGLAVRKTKSLPVRQPLSEFAYRVTPGHPDLDAELEQLMCDELNVKRVNQELLRDARVAAQATVTPGTKYIDRFYLNCELTEELRAEGYARELERQLQDMRKKAGLKVGELVDLYYNTQEPELERVVTTLLDRKKTFINQVTRSLEVEADFEAQAEVGGRAVWLGIVRV